MTRTTGAVSDRLLGFLGAAMILTAAVVFFRGGESDASVPTVPPPVIRILEPASGSLVSGSFPIVFRVENGELTRSADGWGLAGMHIHILVDGGSFMPDPGDIERLSDGTYRWNFAALEPGEHEIRLFWSDAMHEPLRAGGSPALRVRGG